MRVAGACNFTDAWRRSQKLRWHVEVRVRSVEGRNLKCCRSVDEEAVRATRVPKRQSRSEESEAARGRFSETNCGMWGHLSRFRLTGFLGFPHERPRSTSVGLVSTDEVLICTNLIGRGTDCLVVRF